MGARESEWRSYFDVMRVIGDRSFLNSAEYQESHILLLSGYLIQEEHSGSAEWGC
jgi:hypothetical protein